MCTELQEAHGRINWATVAKGLPGRTDDMCRRGWYQLNMFGVVSACGVLCACLCMGVPACWV